MMKPSVPVGTISSYKEQSYTLIRSEPYTRRDGGQTVLLIWETACATCGQNFTFGAANRELKYPNRNCPTHSRKRRA